MTFRELCERTAKIEEVESSVEPLEPYLLDVLQFLKAHPELRTYAADYLVQTLERPGLGSGWLVEYCMRELRWPEVRQRIADIVVTGGDARRKFVLDKILEVFEERYWEYADLFRYHSAREQPPRPWYWRGWNCLRSKFGSRR